MSKFCPKVLSECGKCHFRDTNFKHFPRRACPVPRSWTSLTAHTWRIRVHSLGAAYLSFALGDKSACYASESVCVLLCEFRDLPVAPFRCLPAEVSTVKEEISASIQHLFFKL